MSPDAGKDFDQNMNQLVHLLKKIITGLPMGPNPNPQTLNPKGKSDSGIHVNFCFFNFLPITDEEIEEMDAMYDQFLAQEEGKAAEFSPELNGSDMDFLRRHGIRF